jgi:DNA invertase Pin-like site-specific DNA recombinase
VNEGDSIQAQLSALRKYAEDHNYEIAGEFIDDGVSGTLFNERDELQRLLEEVKKRNVDLIIFTKLDRYFRNLKHYLNTQEVLDKYNVPWIAIWENYETRTPQGRLMVNQRLPL